MASTSGPSSTSHDYTEGASAIDINTALSQSQRARRDSVYNDDGQNMFSGPGHSVNPSSVSRMSYIPGSRRSTEIERKRRGSIGGRRSSSGSVRSVSVNGDATSDAEETAEPEDEEDYGMQESDRISSSTGRRYGPRIQQPKPSVFENITNLFTSRPSTSALPAPRSRRPSLHRTRSSSSRFSRAGSENAFFDSEEEEERWGYSSGEEDGSSQEHDQRSDNSYGSYPTSPASGNIGLPLLSVDPFFGDGEARLDMSAVPESDPPHTGPPSRQMMVLPDEDSQFRFIGFEIIIWRNWIWRIATVLSFGVLGLMGHWFPSLWLRWVTQERAFIDISQGFVVVEVSSASLSRSIAKF